MNIEDIINSEEASRIIGCTGSSFRCYWKQWGIPSVRVAGISMWHRHDIEKFALVYKEKRARTAALKELKDTSMAEYRAEMAKVYGNA